ncbi:MAG: OmpA family protein [Proteobacteria bacterium]|nr:MAG: OmpA family protein [Pseudomonadota bacterium]
MTQTVGLTALLDGGHNKSMLPGTILKAHRSYTNARGIEEKVPVALMKVLEVRDTYSIAEVVTDGSLDSSLHFTDYPELMVGDRAIPEVINIVSRTQLLPTVSLTYKNLFVDPKSNPASFELTPDGAELLIDKAKVFANVRAPLILVEAYTDAKGDRAANQMESQNRAATIRQTLIDQLGIDPERIVALGLGESESAEAIPLPGEEDQARRVIIKVKSLPNADETEKLVP